MFILQLNKSFSTNKFWYMHFKSFYCILKLVDIIIFIWLEIIFKMDGRFSVRNTLMSFSDVSSEVNIKSGCCACFKQAQNKNILFDVNLVGLVYFVFIIVFTKCKLATWNKLKLEAETMQVKRLFSWFSNYLFF